jgi:phosphoribosylformimino-5-aminoimidazole carboxamide ribonucleotide (ProFAR) isomerase
MQQGERKMTNVIFMPTWYDVTIYNVIDVFEEVKDSGIKHFGFKDIGPEESVYEELVKRCQKHGMTIYLEIVKSTLQEHLDSVKMGVRLGVDHIIGGKPEFAEQSLKLLKGTNIKYWPYVGKVIGHPCKLFGKIEEIIEQAKKLEEMGVDGLNVLSYRYEEGRAEDLVKAVKESVSIPIIATGWINTFEKIRKMTELGVWGITVGGTSILARKLVPGGSISDQLKAVLAVVEEVKRKKA